MEITKTVLSLMLVVITILTTLTTVTAAYAGGGDDDEDGNKQKAEDDSSGGIADCDKNDVEEARFDCIAIAANDVEIELPEESATLSVCKTTATNQPMDPEDFSLTVTGNDPSSPAEFEGDANCVDVTIGTGEYAVSEVPAEFPTTFYATDIFGDCIQDPNNTQRATGEIQADETQECTFFNFPPT